MFRNNELESKLKRRGDEARYGQDKINRRLFKSVQSASYVFGELWYVFFWYEPTGKIDDVIEELISIAGCRAQIAVA